MADNSNTFGELVRERREQAELSLRDVAARCVGVGHVYLSQLERGIKPPPPDPVLRELAAAIPTVTLDELRLEAALSRPLQVDATEAPQEYRQLGVVLARRIEEQDLSSETMAALRRLLEEDDDGKRG